MSNVNNKRLYVFSYPEVLGIFMMFSVVLYLLFYENKLEEQVMKESSNYDLTVAYLENMLKQDPKNEELLLALAKAVQKSGNVDLSSKLLNTLSNSKNQLLLQEVEALQYYQYKYNIQNYSKDIQKEQSAKMKIILQNFSNKTFTDISDVKQWYEEAIWMDNYESAYMLTQKATKLKPNDIYWLKNNYYIASKLDKDKEATKALERLLILDSKNKEEWLIELYYRAVENKDFKWAESLVIQLEKISPKWKLNHASLLLRMGNFAKAADIYESLIKDEENKKIKKVLLMKAIESLQFGNMMPQAVTLAKKYEKSYIDDREMMKKFLKLYMSADDLEAASSLSLELLNLDEVK